MVDVEITWSKTKKLQKQTAHKTDRCQVSICFITLLLQPTFGIGQ